MVSFAWGIVLLNTRVLSAKVHTVSLSVILVAQRANPSQILTVKPSPLPTPVKLQRLTKLLVGYQCDLVEFLISRFSHGFPLHFEGEGHSLASKNLVSASHNPQAVDMKLGQELAANRLAGPFLSPPFRPLCVSPLGLVPKRAPGDFRLIHHLSFPQGRSVNNEIASENTCVQYATVADAIGLIKRVGLGFLWLKWI